MLNLAWEISRESPRRFKTIRTPAASMPWDGTLMIHHVPAHEVRAGTNEQAVRRPHKPVNHRRPS
jgi:hypothetical protein